MESFLLKNTKVVETCKETEAIVNEIFKSTKDVLDSDDEWPFADYKPVIFVDFEGVNLGNGGEITLIQISASGKIYIFDVLKNSEIVSILRKIFETRNVVKVFHDCSGDSANLYQQFHIELICVFDTQVVHYALEKQAHKPISLENMCHYYKVVSNPLKSSMKQVYRKNYRFWATRPLTNQMKIYAAADVSVLTEIYPLILKRIEKCQREDMSKLCDKAIRANFESTLKEKQKLLIEKAMEKLRNNINLQKRDITLLKLVSLSPEEKTLYKEAKSLYHKTISLHRK